MEAAQQPAGGMWGEYVPPEIGESFDELEKVGTFVLVEATTRVTPTREYGPKDVADLRVQTTQGNLTRMFSGFSAGIVGQVKRMIDGDLPAVVRIVRSNPTGRGETRGLELVEKIAAGADLRAIANAQPSPLLPTPHSGEDIPL